MQNNKYVLFALFILYPQILIASSYMTATGEYKASGVTLQVSFDTSVKTNKENEKSTHLILTTRAIIVNAYVEVNKTKYMFKTPDAQKRGLKSFELMITNHQQRMTLHCQMQDAPTKSERIVQAMLLIQPQLGTGNANATAQTLTITGKTLITHNKKPPTANQQQIFDHLAVKLIVAKSEYKIDTAGRELPQFAKEMRAIDRKAFINGGGTPLIKPTKLGIFLELTNTSNKDIKLELGGDKGEVGVLGKGAGFLSIITAQNHIDELRGGIGFMLKPRQSHRISFSMVSGFRSSNHNFWTQPGICALSLYATCLLHEENWSWNAASMRITVSGLLVKVNE